MATLLCSLLIGHGFDAFVVSGYASREVTTNNQSRVLCPSISKKIKERAERLAEELKDNVEELRQESKYKLRDPIDLKSKFLKQLDEEERQRIAEEEEKAAKEEQERLRIEEALPLDGLLNKRVHAWVLVKRKGEVFFIEPSTGFRHEVSDPSLVGIESWWNHENFMVNKQKKVHGTINELNWDHLNREHWERLLDVDSDYPAVDNICPKYLDMPLSWVDKLTITTILFEQRFPEQQKAIKYKRTIHEKFAVYKELNGVTEQIKFYDDLDYQTLTGVWEYFENRADLLTERISDQVNNVTMEHFLRGRRDALKSIKKESGTMQKGEIVHYEFYWKSRLDGLVRIEMSPMVVKEFYRNREDR